MIRRIVIGLTALAAALVAPVPAAQAAPAGGSPVVHTDAGPVRGETTAEGRQFLGIPYAAPAPTTPEMIALPAGLP